MAPLPPSLRPAGAEGGPRRDHPGGGEHRIADPAGGSRRALARPARGAGGRRAPRRGREPGRRDRGRDAVALVGDRGARPRGRPGAGRRGGLRPPRGAGRRQARHGHRREHRRRRALRRLPPAEAAADRPAARLRLDRRRSAHPLPPARPLGQPEPDGRARLRRLLPVGLAEAARLPRPAVHRLRPRQRVDRHQRHGAHQRQRERDEPDARSSWRRRRRSPASSGPTASGCT